MSELNQLDPNVPHLKFLRRLVMTLTLTMICGMITLVTLIFLRFQDSRTYLAFPKTITLPGDTVPVAFTQTQHWYSIVSGNNEILIFDLEGRLLQSIEVNTD